MAFKYENVANVGDRIRSYDFDGSTDCYIEGRVVKKDTEGKETREGYACFVVTVDADCWDGAKVTNRIGETIYVPMESMFDWDGRVVKL